MKKVKNNKVISRLSRRILTARKKKNIIAVFAIALTAILFTSVFTIGGNMLHSMSVNNCIMVGTKSHAGFKQFTGAEYDVLKKDEKIRNLSYNIYVGYTINEKLKNLQGEVRYFQDENARTSFSYPTTGKMPQKEDEAAMSTILLDALEIPHELGQKVTLEMIIHNQTVTKTFTLSGFWEGYEIAGAQEVLVSREYCDQVAPLETEYFYEKDDQGDYSGYMNVDFDFPTSFNIEGQMNQLCSRCGFDENEVNTGVNWAYGFSSIDLTTAALILTVLVLILLSGYLIIYNIFYLNIYSDIRFYGLLKTIGTTGRQLRKIVMGQAWQLCLMGIPLGLVLGWAIGAGLTSVVMSMLSIGETYQSVNPLIFLGAALFAWLTVTISCIKPCKMAARVSPVEATKFTEATGVKKRKQKGKTTRKNTLLAMARANLGRNRRKLVLVICSCSLSMILLNSVYTTVTGFDMEKYLSQNILSDFSVTDVTIGRYTGRATILDGVTGDFLEELKAREDVEEIGNVYALDFQYHMDQKDLEILEEIRKDTKYQDYFTSQRGEAVEGIVESKTDISTLYGVDEMTSGMLDVYEGEFDWAKFNSGDYILASAFDAVPAQGTYAYPFSQVGDKVHIEFPSGESKDYEVMAIASVPYPLGTRASFNLGREYILPDSQIQKMQGPTQPLRTIFNVKEGKVEETERWLQDYTEKVNTDLSYESRETYSKEMDNTRRTFAIVGGFLSFILALIGILNFINVIVTSILSRRQELAMMESIGMTGRQQRRMLQYEGLLYGFWTLVLTCTLGIGIGYLLVQLVAGQMWMFSWRFTLLPILLCTPILLVITILVPDICYRQIRKQKSTVERLRITD